MRLCGNAQMLRETQAKGSKHFARVNDVILFYVKTEANTFRAQYGPLDDPGYVERFYRYTDLDGRRYKLDNMLGPGRAAKGNPQNTK